MQIGLYTVVPVLCCLCVSVAQFMPGLSPATPNNALDTCQSRAVPRALNVTHQGSHGDIIHRWCTTYDSVLPCLTKVLPTATENANDWFLSLVYSQPMADRMSRSLCSRFPYISNLTCVTTNMANVSSCMQWNTRTAIENFRRMYNPNGTLSPEARGIAAIYACIISVQTAGCFQQELTACSMPKRKLVYDYYIMLSGKCTEIASMDGAVTDALPTRPSTQGNSTRTLLVGRPNPPPQSSDRVTPRGTVDQSNPFQRGSNVMWTTPENVAYVTKGNVATLIMTLIVLLFVNIG